MGSDFMKCCKKPMVKVYRENGLTGWRCLECNKVKWNSKKTREFIYILNEKEFNLEFGQEKD